MFWIGLYLFISIAGIILMLCAHEGKVYIPDWVDDITDCYMLWLGQFIIGTLMMIAGILATFIYLVTWILS